MSIGLGNIPNYLNTSGTITAIQILQTNGLLVIGSTNNPNYNTIKSQYSLQELLDAGFSILELKLAGFTLEDLYDFGFTIQQLKTGNFTIYDFYNILHIPPITLLQSGYTLYDLKMAGIYYNPDPTPDDETSNIYKYCHSNSKKNGTNIRSTGCIIALPLSKITHLNTSNNTTSISNAMRYSQLVTSYGTTKSTTSYAKKTCRIGGPTFSY
jgi:hypothetical protein